MPVRRPRERGVGSVREDGPMPITLITGPANAGKARVVLETLREHCARGERPLLVVPTRSDVERFVGELALDGRLAQVRVERFEGLLAEAVARAGDAQPPLGALARERVMATVAARTAAGRATRPMTRALVAFVGELEVERVSPARLREALAAWVQADPDPDPDHAARARRLGDVYEEYLRALSRLGRADPELRAVRALDALRRAPPRWDALPVLLYGFDDFTRLQLDAIETLGVAVGARVTVSLAFERGRTAFAGRASTFQTLLPLAAEHHELGPRAEYYAPDARAALHQLERFLFEPACPARVPAGEAVRLLEGGGERAELELVAEEIAALLQRGMAPAEIAVAHRSPGSIAELLGEVFEAHGIPHTLRRRVRFSDTALGRALLGWLTTACEQESELGELLAWLRAPGAPGQLELADELELRARRAGLAEAAQGRALWEAQGWPAEPLQSLERLREAAGDRSAGGALALIERTIGELERLGSAALAMAPGAQLTEARALQAGRAALAELRELALSELPLAPHAEGLIATLRGLELVVQETRQVHPGGTVTVLDPLALRARRVRALFLCGLQEGVFPAPPRPQSLLSEDERRSLAETSGLLALVSGPRGVETLAAERYLLYAAVSRPEEVLVLSWHTADDDGAERARSLFVDDICELFVSALPADRRRRALGELGKRSLGELGKGSQPQDGALAPAHPPGIAPLRDERVLAELRERRLWSASALEAWAGCPARWFVERLLGAEDLTPEPEPLARGGLAHAALHEVLEGLRRETGSARPRVAELPRARRLLHAALARLESRFPLSVAPERVPGVLRRLTADLERYLEHAANRESPLEPAYLELSFGFPDEPEGLPALDLGDGVQVRGRIDRVDVAPAGREAVVYDYKGSRAPEGGKWAQERAFQVALYMRAVEQSPLGLRAVGGFYQPLAGRDLRARGVLERAGAVELQCVRGDAREHAEVQALVEQAVAAAREAAAQVRAGELEVRPDTCGFGGGGCQYPTICRCER
jgi:RecB family exonuclease